MEKEEEKEVILNIEFKRVSQVLEETECIFENIKLYPPAKNGFKIEFLDKDNPGLEYCNELLDSRLNRIENTPIDRFCRHVIIKDSENSIQQIFPDSYVAVIEDTNVGFIYSRDIKAKEEVTKDPASK